jgi:hypothetical protein
MPTKPVAKKPIPGKPQASNPPRRMLSRRSLPLDKAKGLSHLKETLQASFIQKKPVPDKVENPQKNILPSSERLM